MSHPTPHAVEGYGDGNTLGMHSKIFRCVVLRYLRDKSVREFKTGVIDTLRMCWLAIALKELHELPPDQLKQSALNAIDSLEKHIAYIRATFSLESGTGNSLGRAIASLTPMMVVHQSSYLRIGAVNLRVI
jgi:hypothetical protein